MARRIKAVQRDAIRKRPKETEEFPDPEENVRPLLYIIGGSSSGDGQRPNKIGYQYVPPRMTWREKFREILVILRK